jgi:signal transduction histidine kinase
MDETHFAVDVADHARWDTDASSAQQWFRSIGLVATVGIVYFLAARLSLLLLAKPDGVAVFWPASQLVNESLEARTLELTSSLEELRDAQDRLVQTKKLASLGQLTAGIAHEIKNPLNFVNNFSSLSIELAIELQEAIKSPAIYDKRFAEVHNLLDTLQGNLGKIVQHGKRADFDRAEHASAFAPDLRKASAYRSQRTRGGKH